MFKKLNVNSNMHKALPVHVNQQEECSWWRLGGFVDVP